MKAVVWHGIGDIRLDDVPKPKIQKDTDAVIKITASAICGTDLHMIRGTFTGMQEGTILGHEAIGIIEEVGKHVKNLKVGDRVVVPSTIGCGYCMNCRRGYFAQCDNGNPNGKSAGTAFFGGPKDSGPFNGFQAEYARIPYANVGLVKLPDLLTDDQAILLSDILPTAYFGAHIADIKPGQNVVVFGCGPVGQLVIASLKTMQVGRIFAVDSLSDRLEMAQLQGAEIINFDREDPVEMIKILTGDNGVDVAIDAVGVDAVRPHMGPAAKKLNGQSKQFDQEVKKIAPKQNPKGDNWHPGDGPSQALDWAVEVLSKMGTLSIIGVYPQTMKFFPIGKAMNKNLTMKMGNCNHRRYIPEMIDLIVSGAINPAKILTKHRPLTKVIEAYKAFDTRQPDWMKVELTPPHSS